MRILALICALLLISAPTAHAGGWAVTYLDPVPQIEPKGANTIGYWVLQHGNHPFEGDLGKTGLKFRSDAGERVFIGVPLGQPAHYAVTFNLPVGSYEVFAVQGVFQDHPLGTLTVPGTLLVKPVDPHSVDGEPSGPSPWGSIAPPPTAVGEPAPDPSPVPAAAQSEEPAGKPLPVWVVGLVVMAAAGAFLVLRKRLRPGARR